MTGRQLLITLILLGTCAGFVSPVFPADPPADTDASGDRPIGRERPSADIFEKRDRYFHPFLSVAEYYTDNVYNTNDDRRADFFTVFSPGIWLSLPKVKESPVQIETSNTTPGGITLSRFIPRRPGRFQAYFLYRADIERYNRYTTENTSNHVAEGGLQYNFRGGLSIDLAEQFVKSHNQRGTGLNAGLDRFDSNLFQTILSYEAGDRMLLRLDYTNYLVRYAASASEFRDRTDNGLSAYAFYKLWPKTAFFAEYEMLTIDYPGDVLFDSTEHRFFAGFRWDVTAKSKGFMKAGYGIKDFKDPAIRSGSDVLLEARLEHKLSPKTSLKITAVRRTAETDISATDFVVSNSLAAEYLQRLTPKISGVLDLSYAKEKYRGEITLDNETARPDHRYYRAAAAIQYEFKEWLRADLGYLYTRRDSNFSTLGYTNNTVFLRITGSL